MDGVFAESRSALHVSLRPASLQPSCARGVRDEPIRPGGFRARGFTGLLTLFVIFITLCYKNNSMAKPTHSSLTRRERQIMDFLYRQGRATAAEVMAALPGSPTSSTVRTQLRVLEEKGHVRHEEQGLRFIYMPAVPRHAARRSALRHVVDTFFDGSAEKVVAAVLGGEGSRLTDEELSRIADLVENARKTGR